MKWTRALVMRFVLAAANGGSVVPAAAQSAFGSVEVVVGELDARETHVFGRIRALAVGPGGELFIVDDMNHELRWFDASGSFVSRTGRSGRGPGEFLAPVAVAVDPDGIVHVLDPPNLKIARYRPTADGLEHLGDLRIGIAYDFCLIGGRQFTLFPSPDAVLHELDASGGVARSFGNPVSPDGSEVLPANLGMDLLNRGQLACDPMRGRVLRTSERLGRVYAYDVAGRLLWETVLNDFRPVRWERVGARGFRMAADPSSGTAQTVSAVAIQSDGHVLVTVREASASDPDGQLVTRILDGNTGRELAAVPSAAVWTVWRGDDLLGTQERPHPRVVRATGR